MDDFNFDEFLSDLKSDLDGTPPPARPTAPKAEPAAAVYVDAAPKDDFVVHSPAKKPAVTVSKPRRLCPKCGCSDISVQVVNEVQLKRKHKGIFYWLFFGWLIDFLLWFFWTIPRLIIAIFRPKKMKTKNIQRSVCVCQDCGYRWDIKNEPRKRDAMYSTVSKKENKVPKTIIFDGETHKEDFYIAGMSYQENNMQHLCILNPDWQKSTESLVDPDHDVRIYKYTFVNKPVELVPEPTNPHDPNAVKVVVAGKHIGYISADENIHVLEILKYTRIIYISCFFRGGESKTIYSDGYVTKDHRGISGNIRISYIAKSNQ